MADEIALARHISPARAGNQMALARVLTDSLPHTWAHLEAGRISLWAAEEVAAAVLTLDDPDRARVDADLATHLPVVSARRAGALARARAGELDPAAAITRTRHQITGRHVTLRPASDAMVRLTALQPATTGVAAYAALDAHATTVRAAGGETGRGRAMADELVARLTGAHHPADLNLEIQLLMTDQALLADAPDTAWIQGHPVPAPIARTLALETSDSTDEDERARRWVRRLFTDPVTGTLREMDERRRAFRAADRRFVEISQQHECVTPWCDTPIRHIHHIDPYAHGGTTVRANAAGTCERFNYTLEMPGWKTQRLAGDTLRITTPAGRTYDTNPPPLRPAPAPALTPRSSPP